MDATESLPRKRATPPAINLTKLLRRCGMDCAAMISRNPKSWAGEVKWLQSLPMCWDVAEVHQTPEKHDDSRTSWLVVDLGGSPVTDSDAPSHVFHVYDNEAEKSRIQGPQLRRLLTAWHAAAFRFLHCNRGEYSLHDFDFEDARRLALLAALSLNRDFDGSAVGLAMPWDHPDNCDATFEGRKWVWTLLPSRKHVPLIETAIDYLERMPASPSPGDPKPSQAPDTDWRDIKRKLLEMYDRRMSYTTIEKLSDELGCSKATVHKAIKDSANLKGWKARGIASRGGPKAISLTEVVTDRVEQTREGNPTEEAAEVDTDAVLAMLQEDARPAGRAWLERLPPDERRDAARALMDDPDRYSQLRGRRP